MPNGFSSLDGQAKSAYSPDQDPRGSSSGSVVTMSAGLCALSAGRDTSFSIIACATENGVTSVKPTHGALSTRGIVPIAHSPDSAGALCSDLQDALTLLDGMRDAPFGPVATANPTSASTLPMRISSPPPRRRASRHSLTACAMRACNLYLWISPMSRSSEISCAANSVRIWRPTGRFQRADAHTEGNHRAL